MHAAGTDQLILSAIEETKVLLEVQILTDLAFSKQNGKYVACKLQIICNSCCLLNSSPLAGFGSHSPEKLKCRWLVHMEAWPQNGLGVGR